MKERRAKGEDDLTVDKIIKQLEQEKLDRHNALLPTQEIPVVND